MPDQPADDISVNKSLDRIIVGDTAIAVVSQDDGELEITDTHSGASWVEFGGESGTVALQFEEVTAGAIKDA